MRKKNGLGLILILVILIFIISSCNNPKNINKIELAATRYKLNLPDTVQVGETIKGIIIYKSDFDTIKKNIIEHYSYMVLDSICNLKRNDYRSTIIKKDTFGLIYDSIIPFYEIILKKEGVYSLYGHIVDEILLDVNKPNSDEALKIRTLKINFVHKVYVEEKE